MASGLMYRKAGSAGGKAQVVELPLNFIIAP
jgi:hypothetical protein